MWKSIVVLFIFAALPLSGCARTEKVRALDGELGVPYESLGTLEVKHKTRRFSPQNIGYAGVEAASLTLADTPAREDRYKNILRSKLVRIARDRYGAEAVINVKFWPEPSSTVFPEGNIYARGEMVRYVRFPASRMAAASNTSSS